MAKMEIGTLKHAFRDEMHQAVHWSLFLLAAATVWLEVSQAASAAATHAALVSAM